MKKFITLTLALITISGCSNYNTRERVQIQSDSSENSLRLENSGSNVDISRAISIDDNIIKQIGKGRYKTEKIAVLLPFDDSFRDISVAIRDGIISSWFENSTPYFQPEILFLSTSLSISNIVQKIKEENIDFVIGPLRKGLISKIRNRLSGNIGMLALNIDSSIQVEKEAHFQFALAPENEAVQVAEKARNTGKHMLLISPNTDWGNRIAKTYRETWQNLNGQVISEISFNPQEPDYSSLIKRALNIDRSASRRNWVRSLLGTKVEFEARRRKDIDTIILAANGTQARQILPQLRFYRAENIPIFSSSHVFSDFSSKTNNRDLEGLVFGDAPWITSDRDFFLRKILDDTNHPANGYPRLFAFGRDAYDILPFLKKMEQFPYLRMPGATGNLWIDSNKVIRRDLKWYKFKNGRARREGYSS